MRYTFKIWLIRSIGDTKISSSFLYINREVVHAQKMFLYIIHDFFKFGMSNLVIVSHSVTKSEEEYLCFLFARCWWQLSDFILYLIRPQSLLLLSKQPLGFTSPVWAPQSLNIWLTHSSPFIWIKTAAVYMVCLLLDCFPNLILPHNSCMTKLIFSW